MCLSVTNFITTRDICQGTQSRWYISLFVISRRRRDFGKVIIYFLPFRDPIDLSPNSWTIILNAAPNRETFAYDGYFIVKTDTFRKT